MGTLNIIGAVGAAAVAPVAENGVITRIEANAAGNIAAGKRSVSFVNVGTTDATVATVSLKPGESVTFDGYHDPVANKFFRTPAIAYVASATGLLHISTQD